MEQTVAKQCQTDWAANWRFAWLWPAAFGVAVLGWLVVPGGAGDAAAAAGLAVASGLCVGNALHCRRVHCAFTGPLYLLAAALFAGRLAGLAVPSALIVALAAVGSVIAFIPEWRGKRYFARATSGGCER
jgi:hypothetical protein